MANTKSQGPQPSKGSQFLLRVLKKGAFQIKQQEKTRLAKGTGDDEPEFRGG